MAVYVKEHVDTRNLYDEYEEKIDYTYVYFAGPFRTLSEAEEYVKDKRLGELAIWEFE